MKAIIKIIIVLVLVSVIVGPQLGAGSFFDTLRNSSIRVLNFVNSSVIEKIRGGACSTDGSESSKLLNSICSKKFEPIALIDVNAEGKQSDETADSTTLSQAPTPISRTSAISKISKLANEISGTISQTLPGVQQITPNISSAGDLNTLDILTYTNAERAKVLGLAPLYLNTNLSKVAEYRTDDMFRNSYFQHVSPSGEDVASGAVAYGYKFAVIGENIALGNFRSSKDVVDAWMASEGHKKNILNSNYEEIGIFARQGSYNGSNVWIAVQVFAKPSSSCGFPDEALKVRVANLAETQKVLYAKAEAILLLLPSLKDNATNYNAKVTEYNSIVDSVKAITAELEPLVYQYNLEVNYFNTCVKGN